MDIEQEEDKMEAAFDKSGKDMKSQKTAIQVDNAESVLLPIPVTPSWFKRLESEEDEQTNINVVEMKFVGSDQRVRHDEVRIWSKRRNIWITQDRKFDLLIDCDANAASDHTKALDDKDMDENVAPIVAEAGSLNDGLLLHMDKMKPDMWQNPEVQKRLKTATTEKTQLASENSPDTSIKTIDPKVLRKIKRSKSEWLTTKSVILYLGCN